MALGEDKGTFSGEAHGLLQYRPKAVDASKPQRRFTDTIPTTLRNAQRRLKPAVLLLSLAPMSEGKGIGLVAHACVRRGWT